MQNTAKQMGQRRYERAVLATARLEKKVLDARESNHRVWRIKEMLDLIGDVLLAGEMPPDEIGELYLQLGFLINHFGVPSRLAPGRREALGKAIVSEYRKAKKRESIALIKKGDI